MAIFRPRAALRLAFCALALSAATLPAYAKTYVFKRTGRETAIVMPDEWKVSPIAKGIEIRSGDEEIYLWIQAVTDRSIEAAMDEYFKYYTQQGVTFTGAPTQSADKIAGVPVVLIDAPATYQGGATVVRFVVSDAKEGASKGMLIGYWASPKGDKVHDAAVSRIMDALLAP